MKAGIILGHHNYPSNESSMIRSAEAFGINHAFIVGERRDNYRIAQGADDHITFISFDTDDELINYLAKSDHSIVAIENCERSVPIEEKEEYPVNPVFISGNEGYGVPENFIDAADDVVKITQSVNSYIRCLNTTISASIVMHDWFETRYNRDKLQYYD